MKKLLSLLILLSLIGCVRYYKPGAGQAEFNADSAFCEMNAYKFAPPAVERVVIRGAYREPTQTNCLGNINMNENGTVSRGTYYGNTNGTVINNCTTTGGEYVPPATVDIDNNQGARNAAYRNCLHQRGWSTVKPQQTPTPPPESSQSKADTMKIENVAAVKSISNSAESSCSIDQKDDLAKKASSNHFIKISFLNIDKKCRYTVTERNDLNVTSFLIDDNGKTFTDGFQIIYYTPNGNKKYERHYVMGKMTGIGTDWFKNGVKQSEVNYTNGVADGIETRWDENGTKISEVNYHNGLKVKTTNEKVNAPENIESHANLNKEDEFSLLMTQASSLDSLDFVQISKPESLLGDYYINKKSITKKGNLLTAISKSISADKKELMLGYNYYNCENKEIKNNALVIRTAGGEFKKYDIKDKFIKIRDDALLNAEKDNLPGALAFKFVCSNFNATNEKR
jgi:antitoxin component YwqK of YwqJK toxin-antitoxin module